MNIRYPIYEGVYRILTMELADPDSNMSPSEVMDFYSMTYPELTTATVHGPEWENDRTVYRFKTTIGTKG